MMQKRKTEINFYPSIKIHKKYVHEKTLNKNTDKLIFHDEIRHEN